MKMAVAASMLVISAGFAFAADEAVQQKQQDKQAKFEAHKQEMIKSMDARTAELQKSKECLAAAKTKEEAKVCRNEHKKVVAAKKEEAKQKRLNRIEERQKKLDEQKQKLQEQKTKLQSAPAETPAK